MPSDLKIIGLGHYKRTGKDSLARATVVAGGLMSPPCLIKHVSFAKALKEVCHQLYSWDGLQGPLFYETKTGEKLKEVVLPTIGKSPRQIWIDFGQAVRDCVYSATWRDCVTQRRYQNVHGIIISDVRFPNEAEAIKSAGGLLVKVIRPKFKPGSDYADQALVGYDGWDHVVGKSGKMTELKEWGRKLAEWVAND